MALYVAMYMGVRAVVRARRLERENDRKSQPCSGLTALGAVCIPEDRNLDFSPRNLDFSARNLDIANRNLNVRFKARKDLRQSVEVTRLRFYPLHARVRTYAHTQEQETAHIEVAGK